MLILNVCSESPKLFCFVLRHPTLYGFLSFALCGLYCVLL